MATKKADPAKIYERRKELHRRLTRAKDELVEVVAPIKRRIKNINLQIRANQKRCPHPRGDRRAFPPDPIDGYSGGYCMNCGKEFSR